jgi:hypothetical protein
MKIRGVPILFLLLIFPTIAFSQEDVGVEKDFSIAIGFTNYQIIDQLVSNIRHEGDFVSLGLSHHKMRGTSIREIHFNFIFNPLRSRYESEINSMVSNLAINYQYLKQIKKFDKGFQLFLGPVVGLDWHLSYFNKWDESHIYWVSSYFAGMDGRVSYKQSEKVRFNLNVNFPVVALVSRPPERFLYKEWDSNFSWVISRLHDDMKLTSINQYLAVNTTLDLIYTRSEKFKPGLFWRFRYLKNDRPATKEVGIATHTFGAYLIF